MERTPEQGPSESGTQAGEPIGQDELVEEAAKARPEGHMAGSHGAGGAEASGSRTSGAVGAGATGLTGTVGATDKPGPVGDHGTSGPTAGGEAGPTG